MFDYAALEKRAEAIVDEGIRRLDARKLRRRSRWYSRVDPNKVQQASTSWCVLGQLYGDFWEGCADLELDTRTAGQCGFALGDEFMTWKMLDKVWCRKIKALRAEARAVA